MITVSIVSHGHGLMVSHLVAQLYKFPNIKQIILTLNLPEKFDLEKNEFLQIIHNSTPIGFGANHNNAFNFCNQSFFCILNPDIEFKEDVFAILLNHLINNYISLISPVIVSVSDAIEDSARYFPNFYDILKKLFFLYDGRWPLDFNQYLNHPDWVAGMFMLFPSSVYKQIGGFDENFFLYYEDVDICRRLRKQGYQIALCTQVKVIHNAQRASRKNVKFLYWHLKSLFRYLFLKSR